MGFSVLESGRRQDNAILNAPWLCPCFCRTDQEVAGAITTNNNDNKNDKNNKRKKNKEGKVNKEKNTMAKTDKINYKITNK